MADNLDIKISTDLVKPIIENKINQAIIEGLGQSDKVIASVATRILTQKVDGNGNPSKYENRHDKPYIEWLCNSVVTEAAKNALAIWANERREQLQKELFRQITTKKVANALVKAMIDGFTEASKSSYRFKISLVDHNDGED